MVSVFNRYCEKLMRGYIELMCGYIELMRGYIELVRGYSKHRSQ